jgi:hypothetical protein
MGVVVRLKYVIPVCRRLVLHSKGVLRRMKKPAFTAGLFAKRLFEYQILVLFPSPNTWVMAPNPTSRRIPQPSSLRL